MAAAQISLEDSFKTLSILDWYLCDVFSLLYVL